MPYLSTISHFLCRGMPPISKWTCKKPVKVILRACINNTIGYITEYHKSHRTSSQISTPSRLFLCLTKFVPCPLPEIAFSSPPSLNLVTWSVRLSSSSSFMGSGRGSDTEERKEGKMQVFQGGKSASRTFHPSAGGSEFRLPLVISFSMHTISSAV